MATLKKFVPPMVFHPGSTLSEKLKEMGMGVKEFALRTSKPEKTIFAVLNGQSSVTSDMAVAFESVTFIPAHFWLNKQRAYDEAISREKKEKQLPAAYQWAHSFPLADMVKLGWIPKVSTKEEKVKAMLSFFQLSTEKAWDDYYIKQQLKLAFRISLDSIKEPHAISAWLRRGEIQAAAMQVAPFSEKAVRESIPKMKSVCAASNVHFASELQRICAGAGIKLVYTPSLPKAPINGSTRWINDAPCVQMTDRYKRNDIFWFSFFHELGHILLHGKKDIFLENVNYSDKQKEKEDEADTFSSNTLLSRNAENEIIKNNDYSPDVLRNYAERFNVHPGIIVGRLQYRKIISYKQDTDLIEKINIFE